MSWMSDIAVYLPAPDSQPIPQVEQDILDELQFHIEMRTEDNINAGMTEREARQDALRRFGDFQNVHRTCRRIMLGERIMLQRIQAVLILFLLVAVILLGVAFYRGQRANEADTARMMQSLEIIVSHEPPVVVETVPRNGDAEVASSLTEIRATYNKKMMDKSWSWTKSSDETFPQITGEARYEADGKTCVLPVKLQPGKEYVIWLNSEKINNFMDDKGRAAVPYCLRFRTSE
jgi:hypothetical protein